MRKLFFVGVILTATTASWSAQAARHLADYVDANGFLNVQALTCAQLDDTYVEDANLLMAWYSGWFNGLSKKHYMDVLGAKVVQDQVIAYCETNPHKLVLDGIATVLKVDRAILGSSRPTDLTNDPGERVVFLQHRSRFLASRGLTYWTALVLRQTPCSSRCCKGR